MFDARDRPVFATVMYHCSDCGAGGLPGLMKCAPYGEANASSLNEVWMSTERLMVVVAVFESLALFVSPSTETETVSFVVVPLATVELVLTTSWKLLLFAPEAIAVFEVQVNVPGPPPAGAPVQLN